MLSGLVLRQTIAAAAKSRRGGKEGRDAKLMEMTLDSARAPHCVNYAPKWTLWPDCWLQFVGPYLTVARLALAPPPVIRSEPRWMLFICLFISFRRMEAILIRAEVGPSSWCNGD